VPLFRREQQPTGPDVQFILDALEESVAAYQAWPRPKPADLPISRALHGRTDDEVRAAALALLEDLGIRRGPSVHYHRSELISRTLSVIGRRKLNWTPDEALRAVTLAARGRTDWYTAGVVGFVASTLEQAGGCPSPSEVENYVEVLSVAVPPARAAKAHARLRPFTPVGAGTIDARIIDTGDDWGREVRRLFETVDDPTGIDTLLSHLSASSTRPSKRWLARTTACLAASPEGPALLMRMAAAVLDADLRPGRHGYVPRQLFTGANADLARGVMFGVALSDPASAALLGDVACRTGTTASGSGVAQNEKVANGSVAALGVIGTDAAIAALARAQQRIKNRTVRKQIERSLTEAAAAAGLGVDELIERAVPDHGLGPGGSCDEAVGDYVVRLTVEGDRVRVLIARAGGGWTSTVPARLRAAHGDRLLELRAAAKEATKTLVAEKVRIEGLLAADRTWRHPDWVRLYRDHPLTGAWTRRLLWVVGSPPDITAVRVEGDRLVDIDGDEVPARETTDIRLWHPIRAPADQVQAWRAVLTEHERRQPFKQAWREVYLLTPAEEQTETYSNRFAAHILRYGQAVALMKGRDWGPKALGYWDGGHEGTASKVFPGGWRATFHYELIENDDDGFGTPSLCATDQVRFEELHDGRWTTATTIGLVPPLVFSEAMRDVDLFVGVTSIAADPAWVDRGEDRHFAYWHQTSFGELTESAQSRRAALERLLPKTKIADRARIEGRFLRVEGRLRTYRIHLGSGNILMDPNDHYLCIVQARSGVRDRIFLPFEEDGGRLSVILSKALLLAGDDQITDPSIVAQINRR